MRVIAGSARSLQLKAPLGDHTRPTTDRIKETLFNILQTQIGGSVFLDVFSGSGAIGIEALSRGADYAIFIENDKNAISVIEDNLKHTKFQDKAEIKKQDAFVSMQSLEYKYYFDIVFMDPPYNKELEKRVLEYLTMSTIIDENSLIIFEASLETDISYLDNLGYDLIKEKKYKTNKHVFVKRRKNEQSHIPGQF